MRGATWEEIDVDAGIWQIPAERMKAGKAHRVPLSTQALELLAALPRIDGVNFVFSAPRGGPLSDMSLTAVHPAYGRCGCPARIQVDVSRLGSRTHRISAEMAELALAHAIGNKVEAAYRSGDMFERRRRMMSDWATFLGMVEAKGQVIGINGKRA